MTYNVTALVNVSSPLGIFEWANTAVHDTLFGGLLIAIMVILVVRYSHHGLDKALLAGSFICFVIAGVLRYAGLVSILFVLGFLAILVFTAIYVMVRGDSSI
jgi:hypothetical protein